MTNYSGDFHDFKEVVWLNAASEGPLPMVARDALMQAVEWKSAVHELDIPKFIRIPQELRTNIGELLGVLAQDVILGNSASYGLHLLADGLPLAEGDEVVVMQNDFPTDIIPWLALEDKGVKVQQVPPKHWVLTPEELEKSLTDNTKVVCLSHVHTFSGHMLDVNAVSQICRSRGIFFVLNIVQSLGNTPLDVSAMGVDAIVAVGYKWLCGPYGTGFCWIRPEVRKMLKINKAYWSAYLSAKDLESEGPVTRKRSESARMLDQFGTANFFNYMPLSAAIAYWLRLTIPKVQAHNSQLVDQLVEGLDPQKYELISPSEKNARTNLVVLSSREPEQNERIYKLLQENRIYTAFWKGRIRIAPHIYNSSEQIDQLLSILNTD